MKDFYLLNKQTDEEIMNNTRDIVNNLIEFTKLSQKAFEGLYHIPHSTLQGWKRGKIKLSPYLLEFLYTRIMYDFEHADISRKKNDLSSVREFYLLNKMSDDFIRDNTRDIVRKLRNTANLSQRQFCELYHIQHGVLSQWESNVKKPSANLLEFLYTRVMLDFKS